MYKHLSAPTLPEASQTVARAEQIGDYELGDTLGVGAYAVVRLATHRKTAVKAAVKIIPKDSETGLAKSIQKELTIHRGLQHRNISKFLESKEEPECIYIFVEYAAAGELFDKIGNNHLRLLTLMDAEGSVLEEEYSGDAVDIWSCGIILYVMMIGNTPWELPSADSDEFRSYQESRENPKHEPWNRLQGPVRKLLLGMLRINPTKRYSVKHILKDEWYNRPNALLTDGLVNDPVQLASLLMENVNDASNCSPVQSMAFDVRNYASSQPARNNERASDSSLGARIAISWQDEALELSQPATQFTEATFLEVFSSERLTRFFSQSDPDFIVDSLADAMVSNLVAHTVHANLQKIAISTTDQRRCFLTGDVKVVPYGTDSQLVMFVKSRGDPLEWKRMFKALVSTLLDAENPIHLQMNP
ncbi:Chk1 protein kinase [Linnemannia hyalina]|uniref:non-specific serine/threonine protein kinase n=1 Tax=Linnemannia hyalina TaxID=64524 RepID=A0A9P8BZ29_9FUNG|nr:Chk1 protein kinase [Linnemannia hyalina]